MRSLPSPTLPADVCARLVRLDGDVTSLTEQALSIIAHTRRSVVLLECYRRWCAGSSRASTPQAALAAHLPPHPFTQRLTSESLPGTLRDAVQSPSGDAPMSTRNSGSPGVPASPSSGVLPSARTWRVLETPPPSAASAAPRT